MTPLEPADRLMSSRAGDWLVACEDVTVTNMHEGGTIKLLPGQRVRVRRSDGVNMTAITERAETVGFGHREAVTFEREQPA